MVLGNFFWEYKNKKCILSYFIVLTALAFFVYLQSLGANVKTIIILLTCILVVTIICLLVKIAYEYTVVKTGKKVTAKIKNIYVPNINKKVVYRHGEELFYESYHSKSIREDYVYIVCYADNCGFNQKIEQKFFTPFCEVEGKDFYKENEVVDVYFSSDNKRFVMLYGELLNETYYAEKKNFFIIMNLVYLIYFIIIGIKTYIHWLIYL